MTESGFFVILPLAVKLIRLWRNNNLPMKKLLAAFYTTLAYTSSENAENLEKDFR